MQTITPELEAILKSKFQAAADGFRARVFRVVDGAPDITCPMVASDIAASWFSSGEQSAAAPPGTYQPPDPAIFPSTMFLVAGYRNAGTFIGTLDGIAGTEWSEIGMEDNLAPYESAHDLFVGGYRHVAVGDVVPVFEVEGAIGAAVWAVGGVSVPTDQTTIIQLSTNPTVANAATMEFATGVTAGNVIVHLIGGSNSGGADPNGDTNGWTRIGFTKYGCGIGCAFIAAYYRCVDEGEDGDTSFPNQGFSGSAAAWGYAIELSASQTGYAFEILPPVKRVDIDKSLRLGSDGAQIEFANEDLPVDVPTRPSDMPLGWGPTSIFETNQRIAIEEWYGDTANAIRTFTGLIDETVDTRDPLTSAIKLRDMMAVLDAMFSASAPQGAGETGAVRTEANGVFLNREVSYIVGKLLDMAGWRADERAISDTSYVLDEFVIADGQSYAEALIGDEQLTGLVGYSAWADEFGIFHFAPTLISQNLSNPETPVYTFRSGEDVTSLQDSTDQYELKTRVKVRGPLTTETLEDTWIEEWRTTKIKHPVGIWYDPTDTAYIRVIDRETRRLYKLRQSDRVIVSSVYLGAAIGHPLGLSGDPADATIYWVLNAPWIHGISGGNYVAKVRKSDNHVLAKYSIPSGRWSAIKVSSANMWLTNLDTDRLYKRSKANASAVADYRPTYASVLQSNPSGLMIDGTTLHVFWANGGSTARFLVSDESAPNTITKVVKTGGTTLHGGEMDTTTHAHCWGDNDSNGLVAKFQLKVKEEQTTEVSAEVVCVDMEDELGALALLERRVHDAHPSAPAHRWQARRSTLDLTVITSLAQATETAQRQLDILCQRRRVLDVGIVGNPALQKTDYVAVVDVQTGLSTGFAIDTYRSTLDAEGTYVGTLSLLPIEDIVDTPTDSGGATDDLVADQDGVSLLVSDQDGTQVLTG